MSEIRISLPDKSVKTFDHEPSALEVAMTIGERLAKETYDPENAMALTERLVGELRD